MVWKTTYGASHSTALQKCKKNSCEWTKLLIYRADYVGGWISPSAPSWILANRWQTKLIPSIEMVSGSSFMAPLSLTLAQILLCNCCGSASGHADVLPWTSFTSTHLPGVTLLSYWGIQNGYSQVMEIQEFRVGIMPWFTCALKPSVLWLGLQKCFASIICCSRWNPYLLVCKQEGSRVLVSSPGRKAVLGHWQGCLLMLVVGWS